MPQLPSFDRHGKSDRIRDEVLSVPKLRAPGPGHTELPGGRREGRRGGQRWGASDKDS